MNFDFYRSEIKDVNFVTYKKYFKYSLSVLVCKNNQNLLKFLKSLQGDLMILKNLNIL